jgi:hypothetical protein
MTDLVNLVYDRLRVRQRNPANKVLQPAPLLTKDALHESEIALGFEVPPELKELYCCVGNGGFGPGYGLLGLINGATDDLGNTAVSGYQRLRNEWSNESATWPEGLLPICNWGCAIYSCINCVPPEYEMTVFDPNPHDDSCADWSDAFFPERCSFAEWITLWAKGTDLWARLYGQAGLIAGILLAREAAR